MTSSAGIDTDPSNRFEAKSTTITRHNPMQYNTPLFIIIMLWGANLQLFYELLF